jgi:peptidoglycan/xylan/chitin deacetylase (PgdA/CDA1 family)
MKSTHCSSLTRTVFLSMFAILFLLTLIAAFTAASAKARPSKWPGRLGIVVLQFDDSTIGHYTHAFRILEKYQLKGSFGVITGALGRGGSLTRAQVVEMYRAGHEIHDHTLNHDAALWGDPARQDEWHKQIAQSLGILKELGITTRGWNHPGGKGARWTPELRAVLAPHYDYVAGRVDLKREQLSNTHWNLKDDPLCLGYGGVAGWGAIAKNEGAAKEVPVTCSQIADGIQQGLVTIPLWHVLQDADGSAWGLEEVCKFVRGHNLPSMVMADAVRAMQNPRDYFDASVEQMPNLTFTSDYDENGRPDGYLNGGYAPQEIAGPDGGRVAQWTGSALTWIYGPEPGLTRLALTARTADGTTRTVTPVVTITEIDKAYGYHFREPQRLAPITVGPNWHESQTSLMVAADADRVKIEFGIAPPGAIWVSRASWRIAK